MKFGSKLQFECPDVCPKDCLFISDFKNYGQNAMCCHCPVLSCREPTTEEDKMYMPMVPANQFRDDWAEEWNEFFKTGKCPRLLLHPKKKEK